MSSCTRGVAVAVSAITGAGRSCGQALAEHAVVGPEVVAPLRDAVRLVDRDERRLAPGEHLGEAGHAEPLGRDEQEVEPPVEVGAAAPAATAARSRPEWMRSARRPSAWSFATWSSISAMSGLTTSVVPPRARPGSW